MSQQYWSGCNYYINNGGNDNEPLGTAMSMHDCDGCAKLATCTAKKTTPVWPYDKAEHERHFTLTEEEDYAR